MRLNFTLAIVLLLAACSSESGSFRHPTISNSNASSMSSDTLCYRYAGAKKDTAIADEVRARHLDCAAMLENDPLYQGR